MDRHYPTPKDLPVVHRPSTEYLKMAKVALGASDRPLSYLKMLKDALAPRETSYQGLWEQRRARGLSAARVSKPAGRGITTSWRVQEEEAPEGKGMAALVRAMEGVAIQGTEVYGRELVSLMKVECRAGLTCVDVVGGF